jgi:hypothetical protein
MDEQRKQVVVWSAASAAAGALATVAALYIGKLLVDNYVPYQVWAPIVGGARSLSSPRSAALPLAYG